MLSKEAILNADDLKTEVVDVPEWGGEIIIRGLTGKTREVFETIASEQSTSDASNIRASMAALSIVDEAGALMFTNQDVIKLGEKSYIALDRVFKAAKKLNGLGSVEDLEKN